MRLQRNLKKLTRACIRVMPLPTGVLCVSVLLLSGAFAVSLAEQEGFQVTRSSIDGGGRISTNPEGFELSGTIGQPHAGRMAGAAYELTGGFWFEVPLQDCNEDGTTSTLDHVRFVTCMTGPSAGPLSDCSCHDTDGDGDVDLADFALFQVNFSGR